MAGIAYMLAAMGVLASMDAAVKVLVTGGLPAPQLIALRGWIIALVLLAWLPREGGFSALRAHRPVAMGLRALVGAGAPILFFQSLVTLGLAEATAITFSATFIMAILSVPVLGERVGPHRWAAIGVGFLGVLIVTRPGTAAFQPAALLALGAGAAYAALTLSTRWLGPTESTYRLVFWFNAGTALTMTAVLPLFWQPMTLAQLAGVAGVAGLSLVGHLLLTRAFIVAPVGVVGPIEYTALVYAALFGFLLFGTVPDIWVVVGAAVIVSSGLYLVHRERRAAAEKWTMRK
ncbi:MAG: DMT family transporter [Rhodobacterales bacterium]|nr:DMT family transporter [Rhodobacterales bacterium]